MLYYPICLMASALCNNLKNLRYSDSILDAVLGDIAPIPETCAAGNNVMIFGSFNLN